MSHEDKNGTDVSERVVYGVGGSLFKAGVEKSVTVVTGNPLLGKAAGAVASHVPDKTKNGAMIGGVIGASIAGPAAAGAGSLVACAAVMAPVVLGGAVIVGLLTLFSDD